MATSRNPNILIFRLISTIIVIVSLYYAIQHWPTNDEWKLLFENRNKNYIFLFFTVTLAIILRGYRWWLFANIYIKTPFPMTLAHFGWSFFVMSFSPFRTGELLRVIWFKENDGSAFNAAGIIISERLQDLFSLSLILLISILPSIEKSKFLFELSLLLFTLCFMVYLVSTMFLNRVIYILNKYRENIQRSSVDFFVLRIINTLKGLNVLNYVKINLKTLFITIFLWSLLSIACHYYLSSYFHDLFLFVTITTLLTVNLSGLISLLPGNLILYEVSGLLVISYFGYNESIGLIAISGLHIFVLLTTISVGVICFIYFKSSNYNST